MNRPNRSKDLEENMEAAWPACELATLVFYAPLIGDMGERIVCKICFYFC